MVSIFRNLGIVGILLAIMGCSAISKINKAADQAEKIVNTLKEKVDKIDTNKDGRWSLEEILIFLGLPASLAALILRNIKSDKRKSKIEEVLKDIADRPVPPTM